MQPQEVLASTNSLHDNKTNKARPEPLLISIDAASALLGISTKTGRRMADLDELPGVCRVRRRVMVRRADLVRWIEAGCPAPGKRRNAK
jgi:excisionase family DNA binding protein